SVEVGYREPLVWGVPVTAERLDLNVPAGRAIEVDVPHRGIGRPGARGLLGERLGIISREDPVLAAGAVCAVWTWRQGDVRKVVLCPEVHREPAGNHRFVICRVVERFGIAVEHVRRSYPGLGGGDVGRPKLRLRERGGGEFPLAKFDR